MTEQEYRKSIDDRFDIIHFYEDEISALEAKRRNIVQEIKRLDCAYGEGKTGFKVGEIVSVTYKDNHTIKMIIDYIKYNNADDIVFEGRKINKVGEPLNRGLIYLTVTALNGPIVEHLEK